MSDVRSSLAPAGERRSKELIAMIALLAIAIIVGSVAGLVAVLVKLITVAFHLARRRPASAPPSPLMDLLTDTQELTDQEFHRLMSAEWPPMPD